MTPQKTPAAVQNLKLLVVSPEKVIYEGNVSSVSSTNQYGPFDILPYHSNFISIITDYLNVVEAAGNNKELRIEQGLLKVANNMVVVLLGFGAISKPTPA